ncbi:hypothetical protein [Sphingomonas sp. R1]|uniref:hypothetical protein n=1 Tax=Sphingomonas sp. R1 TaxID=399176 RepID=UPI002224A927|nr:hypothetical protein [Sphingomonas sp. R1]UYY77487.1 hypothetical protein OIM94_00290 [Sphingomonas sp. R1]
MAQAQFFRQNGTIQFDAAIAPYIFQNKGTTQTFNVQQRYPQWTCSAPSSFFVPMNYEADETIAIMMPNGYAYSKYATLASYGGSSLNGWQHIYHTNAPAGSTITYYRFQNSINVGSGYTGPGLRLYNPAGQLTFDSAMRPAIVAGTLSGNGSTINLNGSRAYASIIQSFAGYEQSYFTGSYEEYTDEKGNVYARYWNGYSSTKMYGIRTNNAASASVVEVPFYDTQYNVLMSGAYQYNPPANSSQFNLPLENALMVDVTGI